MSRIVPSRQSMWLRRMPSCLAPSRAIASRDWWLWKWVRNSTAMQIEQLEGPGHEQKLRCGVDSGSLHPGSHPGGTDLYPPVLLVDVHVGGHSDCLAVRRIDDRPGRHLPRLLQGEPSPDFRPDVLGRRHAGVPAGTPEIIFRRRIRQVGLMDRVELFQPHKPVFQARGTAEGPLGCRLDSFCSPRIHPAMIGPEVSHSGVTLSSCRASTAESPLSRILNWRKQ